jgi:hypothetical protein
MFHLFCLVLDSINKVPWSQALSGLRVPDISLTRLLADYLTSTRLTPYYSESILFNFLLIPILSTVTNFRCCRHRLFCGPFEKCLCGTIATKLSDELERSSSSSSNHRFPYSKPAWRCRYCAQAPCSIQDWMLGVVGGVACDERKHEHPTWSRLSGSTLWHSGTEGAVDRFVKFIFFILFFLI